MIQDESIPIEVRISAPITWDVQLKFIIQELRENHYDGVINLMKHHYLREEPMCRSIRLQREKASLNAYLELIKAWIKDKCSFVALSRKSGRVVGALICKINKQSEKSNTYSRVQIYSGESLPAVMALKSALIQNANAFEELKCTEYLRVYALCVHPSYKSKPVAKLLLEASLFNAFYLQIPIVAGIFTAGKDQVIAKDVGFTLLTEIFYNKWLADDEIVFDDPGVGNYSAAFMFMNTPDEKTLIDNMENKKKELEKEMLKLEKKRLK